MLIESATTYQKTEQNPENIKRERIFPSGEQEFFPPESKNFSFQETKNFPSGEQEFFPPESKNFSPNDNVFNKTTNNDTNLTTTTTIKEKYKKPVVVAKTTIGQSNQIYNTIKEMYNKICTKLSPVSIITQYRREEIDTLFGELELSDIQTLFTIAQNNNFLTGGGERGFVADFDWLINIDNAVKVLEDKYSKPTINPNKRKGKLTKSGDDLEDYEDLEQIEWEILQKGVC